MSRTKGTKSEFASSDTRLKIVEKHFKEGKTFRELSNDTNIYTQQLENDA